MTQQMASIQACEAHDLPLDATRGVSLAASPEKVKPLLAVAVFLLVFVFCVLASYLDQHSQGITTIWISNALLFAILIRQPRSTWRAYLFVGYVADAIGGILVVRGSVISLMVVAACNTLEVALAAFLLFHWFGPSFRLSRPRPLSAFFGVGVILAPAIACGLSSLWLSTVGDTGWWSGYVSWFLGDALGMAIVAPLVFVAQEPCFFAIFRRRALPKTLLVLAVTILGTFIDFSQNHEPLPVFIVPSLIYATFRRGFPGAVMAVFCAACVAITVTYRGHGLMTLSRNPLPIQHIVAVQVFIAATLFAIFPIAALLEESQALSLSLRESETRYMELAHTDALTGQANRRAFEQRLETEWQRSVTLHSPLALLALDIDHFKAYNDLYGHIAGDDCLRQIAAIAASSLHETTSARLYRIGGEEFAIILPGAGLAETQTLAERIRLNVFIANIEHKGNPLGRNTVSLGLVTGTPLPSQTALTLIALSDKALYTAKHNGRNRCEVLA